MTKTRRLLLLLTLAGCDVGEITRFGAHPEVASVRIFGPEGEDLSEAVRLPTHVPTRVEVRLYDAEGGVVEGLEEDHWVRLSWEPARNIRVDSIPGEPLAWLVTLTDPCSTPDRLRVGYGHSPAADERMFGPFPVAARSRVRSARLFGPAGEELTPEVRLPHYSRTRIEARFYDCAGERVTQIDDSYGMQIFWSSGDFAHVDPVEGSRFQRDVVVLQPPGTQGQMSIGFGTGSYPVDQVFGPWRVTVYR